MAPSGMPTALWLYYGTVDLRIAMSLGCRPHLIKQALSKPSVLWLVAEVKSERSRRRIGEVWLVKDGGTPQEEGCGQLAECRAVPADSQQGAWHLSPTAMGTALEQQHPEDS